MYKAAFTALALVAVSGSAAMAADVTISDSCKQLFTSMVGDEKLNACFPIASLMPLFNSDTPTNADSLNAIFTQVCSTKPCAQSMIDGYASKVQTQCASDLQGINNPAMVVSGVLKMYTPLQKASCYLDQDKKFCMAKNILSMNIDISKGVPEPDELLRTAKKVDVCTKCNQHIFGTFMDYINKNQGTTFPVTADQHDKVMNVLTEQCGADYTQGLATATEAPYPDVQKSLKMQSAGSLVAASSSMVAVGVFVSASVFLRF